MLPKDTQYAAFTATATRTTKHTIFEVLGMNPLNTFVLEKSPMKPNLKFNVEYVGNNVPLEEVFKSILLEVNRYGVQTVKTLIFCQTRAQAATIWRMFEYNLGRKIYASEKQVPENRLVEMFHAGTPERVKQYILNNVTNELGNIRVLVCTIAFGMGVNCKGVHRIVHFGPPKSVESYLQECGRAGRDNATSYCHLLYNGFLQTHCDNDIKEYIQSDECRRQKILSSFSGKHPRVEGISQCECCDVCKRKCIADCCIFDECKQDKFYFVNETSSEGLNLKKREVSNQNKELVHELLQHYMDGINDSTVPSKNIYTEFSQYHITQVLKNIEYIFCKVTLKQHVEIWRREHALKILVILNEVFEDIEPEEIDSCTFNSSDMSVLDYDGGDWQQMLDDSEYDALAQPSLNSSEIETSCETLLHSEQSIQYSLTEFLNLSGCVPFDNEENSGVDGMDLDN